MDGLVVLALLVFLILLIGALLGWLSFFKLRKLTDRINILEKQLISIRKTVTKTVPKPQSAHGQPDQPAAAPQTVPPRPAEPPEHVEQVQFERVETSTDTSQPSTRTSDALLQGIRNNWMIWLGGACVGLAGIFLVKYSIERGLLGPAQRVALGIFSGIALHLLAEWLRRRTRESHPAFAALAGGASIMLYAALLAALHLYHLLNPTVVFAALVIISLATMTLALFHGPVLAIIGILGGYVVPLLVSTNSNNIVGAMIYSLIISAAALLLMRHVYRVWLWGGILAGALGWWLLSFTDFQADSFRGHYLAILTYLILAIPQSNWLLLKKQKNAEKKIQKNSKLLPESWSVELTGLFLIILAQAVSIGYESFSRDAFFLWTPLPVLLLLASGTNRDYRFLPWLSLLSQWFAWLFCGLDFNHTPITFRGLGLQTQQDFLLFGAGMTAIYSGLSWLLSRRNGFCHFRASILSLTPVLWLALAYLLVTDLTVNWQWSGCSVMLGTAYLSLAGFRLLRNPQDGYGFWLILAGHFAFSLAAAMFFREANLTLVLATQILSLVLLIRHFARFDLELLVKAVLALVVIRLTANPWLLHYPTDIHWSLWTYGGTTLCCGLAAWYSSPERELKRWLEAGSLQLLVLFLAAETRYYLYNGNIFAHEYTLTEAAINTTLWSGLGLVYNYRRSLSSYLQEFYGFCSTILLLLALASYLSILTGLNPLWSQETVAATPIWNLLLGAFGAPVLMAFLCRWFLKGPAQRVATIIGTGGLFIFISIEIRHLWQQALHLSLPFKDGELYTYSIVWLIMAVTTILLAVHISQKNLYKAGMVLLLVVIAKIFLIDMSDLEGLLRVASFMGLGLALLGLAYLHQKLSNKVK